jgi:hypothetical protein
MVYGAIIDFVTKATQFMSVVYKKSTGNASELECRVWDMSPAELGTKNCYAGKNQQQFTGLDSEWESGQSDPSSLRGGPISKQVKVLEMRKTGSWVPTRAEIKTGCAGERQQQFTRPTSDSSRSREEEKYGYASSGARNQEWLCWPGLAAIYQPRSSESIYFNDGGWDQTWNSLSIKYEC